MGASQPVSATGQHKAQTEHPANSASNPEPLAGSPKVPLFDTKASNNQQGAYAAQTQSKTASAADGWVDRWQHKFTDDPIVAFTVVLAVSTILLWRETRGLRLAAKGQAEDTKEALRVARDAANAAQESADAATKGAVANEATVAAMRETATHQLRAYLSVNMAYVDGDVALGRPFKGTIGVKNFGQTPAYNVVGTRNLVIWDFDDLDESVDNLPYDVDPIQIGIIQPGDALDSSRIKPVLTREEAEGLLSGKMAACFFGQYTYNIAFDNVTRTTTYCYLLRANMPGQLDRKFGLYEKGTNSAN